MKKEVKRLGISTSMVLMVMVLFGSLFSSCYTKDDLPVVPPTVSTDPAEFTVTMSVVDYETNAAISGVKFFPGKVTEASGKYTYTQTGSGNVTFSLVKEGYEDISYTITLPEAKKGEKVSLDATFYMKKVKTEDKAKYHISGKVFDGITNQPIDGATISGALRADATVALPELVTDGAGTFLYTVEEAGIYDLVIKKDGMNDVNYAVILQKVANGEEYYFNMEVPMYAEGTEQGKTYTLTGNIIDENGNIYSSAATLRYRNNDGNEVSTEVHGSYFIQGLKSGKVTIFLSTAATDYNGYSATYDLSNFSAGSVITLPVYLSKTEDGKIADVVVPEEDKDIKVPVIAEVQGETVKVDATVSIPAGALKETTLITTALDGTVEETVGDEITSTTPAAATFVTGTFLPSGLEFETPITWSVKNPFGTHVFNDLKLEYSKDGGKTWTNPDKGEVKATPDSYDATLYHFSDYRMVVASTAELDTVDVALATESYYLNESGKNFAKGEGKFTIKVAQGYEFVTSVEDALTTAGINDASVKLVLDKAISKLLQGANNGIVNVDRELTNDIDVQTGFIYIIKTAKQQYNTTTYTFKINNQDVKVVVKVAGAVTVAGEVELYNADHHTHGGHFTNGGSGGGNGGSTGL